jgi:DNA-binding transcriptional LysR family regulator
MSNMKSRMIDRFRDMMELRHLRYFVAVAEELHFGRAARRLGISQPPLSQQLRALEQALGAPLLERTSRRVRLTEAGQLFLIEARATLVQAERASDVVRRVSQGEAGELAIGFAPSAPLVTKVASALFRFREAYPSVELQLSELTRLEQVEMVANGQLDLGFIRGLEPDGTEGLIVSPFLEEEMILALRRDHPLASHPGPLRIAMLAQEP